MPFLKKKIQSNFKIQFFFPSWLTWELFCASLYRYKCYVDSDKTTHKDEYFLNINESKTKIPKFIISVAVSILHPKNWPKDTCRSLLKSGQNHIASQTWCHSVHKAITWRYNCYCIVAGAIAAAVKWSADITFKWCILNTILPANTDSYNHPQILTSIERNLRDQ